ncbi:hypothetical protein [Bradyrhizobium retamae]|uniref:Uncharacterized protein n=1 Tax=Bradyrhizobium retamae TaxID=1300035 RepID=A0A0R3MNE9_9BRAD|nr:hypothetical protein [Bradyrhizobium retamae]KRR21689.1 hypothetical protein CQ13_06460 [Bradyrhizobium retamae]
MSDEPLTAVLFRADKRGPHKGEVTAVFPREIDNGNLMGCYAHIGQHGSCSREWYATTRPATPAEYESLKRELESAPFGYRFKVYKRIPGWMA